MIQRLSHDAVREATIHRVVAGGKALETTTVPELPSLQDVEAEAYRLAYAEGYEAGEADGLRDAERRIQSIEDKAQENLHEAQRERERLSALLGGLNEAVRLHDEAMETLAFEIALASLQHAFGAMSEDRQLLQRLCRCMADEFRAKATRLVVSMQDRPCLPDEIEGLSVVVEPGLSPGECRISTGRGEIESSTAQRLAAIHEAMQQMLGNPCA